MDPSRMLKMLKSSRKRYDALVEIVRAINSSQPSDFRQHAGYIMENMNDWDYEEKCLGVYVIYRVYGPTILGNIASTISRLLRESAERYREIDRDYMEYLMAAYMPAIKERMSYFQGDIPILGKFISYPIFNPEDRSGDDRVYIWAIEALTLFGSMRPELVASIVPLVSKISVDTFLYMRWTESSGGKGTLRYACWKFLYSVGVRAPMIVMPHLISMTTHTKRRVVSFAETLIFKISERAPEATVSALIQVLGTERIGIRLAASEKLKHIITENDGVGVEQLIWALESQNTYVREHSAQTLGLIARERPDLVRDAVSHLCRIVEGDPIKDVRQQAVDALYYTAREDPTVLREHLKTLIAGMNDAYHHVRWRAVQLTGMLGERDREAVLDAIEYVMECSADRHDHVRWRAEEAINRLGIDKGKYILAKNQIDVLDRNRSLPPEKLAELKMLFRNMDYDSVLKAVDELKSGMRSTTDDSAEGEHSGRVRGFTPQTGGTYMIVSEGQPTAFYGTVKVLANLGWPVLLATNMHPRKLNMKYGLTGPNIHILFVSDTADGHMDASDLSSLKKAFMSFVNNSRGVLAVDIVDSYIPGRAGKIASLLLSISNMTAARGAVMIISMVKGIQNLQEFASLVKASDLVEGVPPFRWSVLKPINTSNVRFCRNCGIFYRGTACPICGEY